MSQDYDPSGYQELQQLTPVRKRGRKSAEALSTPVLSIVPGERPPPPEDLTEEQAKIWRATLARMPADWGTPEIWPLLKQLCRHESISAMLGRELAEIVERGTRWV